MSIRYEMIPFDTRASCSKRAGPKNAKYSCLSFSVSDLGKTGKKPLVFENCIPFIFVGGPFPRRIYRCFRPKKAHDGSMGLVATFAIKINHSCN